MTVQQGGSALRRWLEQNAFWIILIILVALVGSIVWAIVHAAPLTLAYINTLRWPVAVVLLIFFFRRPIAALLDRIEKGKVSTPFGGGEFEAGRKPADKGRQEDDSAGEDGPSQLPHADEGIPEGEVVPAPDQTAPLVAQNSELLRELHFERLLNTIFSAQLTFLSFLRAAPEGVPYKSVQEYFEQVQAASEDWKRADIPGFLNFLLNERLVEVGPNGNYRLSQKGREFLAFTERVFFAQKKA